MKRGAGVAPSKRHKHEWVLVDKYDGSPKYRPLPEGRWVPRGGLFGGTTYIPGFDHQMVLERIVDIIHESDQPYFTSQTWACHCGKTKTNTQKHLGVTATLRLSQQDTRSTPKSSKGQHKIAPTKPPRAEKG